MARTDLNDITAFLAIAREGSFTRGSFRLISVADEHTSAVGLPWIVARDAHAGSGGDRGRRLRCPEMGRAREGGPPPPDLPRPSRGTPSAGRDREGTR